MYIIKYVYNNKQQLKNESEFGFFFIGNLMPFYLYKKLLIKLSTDIYLGSLVGGQDRPHEEVEVLFLLLSLYRCVCSVARCVRPRTSVAASRAEIICETRLYRYISRKGSICHVSGNCGSGVQDGHFIRESKVYYRSAGGLCVEEQL